MSAAITPEIRAALEVIRTADAMRPYHVLVVDAQGDRHETTAIAASAQQAEDIAIEAAGLAEAPAWVRTRRA